MVRRQGIAMLFVLLISSLVLIGIVTATGRVIAEKRITTSDYASKRALSVAESGLQQTLAILKNTTWSGSGFTTTVPDGSYLTSADAAANVGTFLMTLTSVKSVVPWGGQNPDSRSSFSVKVIKPAGAPVWNGSTLPYHQVMPVQVYVLGEVFSRDGYATADLLARRVVSGSYSVAVDLRVTPPPPDTSVFNYGLFSDAGIAFGGGADVNFGDIWSNGGVDLGQNGKQRLDTGKTIYAVGAVTGKASGDLVSHPTVPITFPVLNVPYYKSLAGQFLTGTGIYDGDPLPDVYPTLSAELHAWVYSDLGNKDPGSLLLADRLAAQTRWLAQATAPAAPVGVDLLIWKQQWTTFMAALRSVDTSSSSLRTWLQQTLLGTSSRTQADILANPGVTIGGINSVSGAVAKPSGVDSTVWTAFVKNEATAVFYVVGSASIEGGALRGTIVIDGDPLEIRGNVTIGDPSNLALAILTNGSIRITGSPTLSGLIYTSKGIDFGSGNVTFHGSIVSKDPMAYSGSFETDYSVLSVLPYTSISGPVLPGTGGISAVSPSSAGSGWTEQSYAQYLDP